MSDEHGCYICRSDDPAALDGEGCRACDAAFFARPIVVVVDPQGNGDS